MNTVACYNGALIDAKDVLISPYDLGLVRGYAVFDVMRTFNGKPFLCPGHYKRLRNSAKEIGLTLPVSSREFATIVENLLRINGFRESRIRTVLTGGPSPDGYSPVGKETYFILIEEIVPLPDRIYLRGAKVITVEYYRECPRIKSTNYVAAMQHHREKVKRGAIEILYTHRGKALEGSVSNLFMVSKNRLVTPKNDMLSGITRNLVIKLSKKRGIPIYEREISLKELLKADEIFMTSTTKGIVPIVKVDGTRIGKGKVGAVTASLTDDFRKYAETY
jgi:branched-chain amino acid aminotransferase